MTPLMSKYATWQQHLRELLMYRYAPDFAGRLERVRQALVARLRIMTTADLEERRAIEDTLQALKILEEVHGNGS